MSDAPGYEPQGRGERLRAAAAQRGWPGVSRDVAGWLLRAAAGSVRAPRPAQGFTLGGQSYAYLVHRHKLTWLTERAIEVSVVGALVEQAPAGARVLEVGHVLGHYGEYSPRQVLDRYEKAPGVLNRDVLDPGEIGPFDLIVAISTLEHVGLDERPRDRTGPVRAVAGLKELLAPGGRLVFSVPVGYNRDFDAALQCGEIELAGATAMTRTGPGTRWREVPVADAWAVPYDFLLYSARAVVFASVERN